jgi:hypothetical protein
MKPILSLLLLALLAIPVSAQARDLPDVSQFETDYCTWFPDGDYAECCAEHDREYFFGGSLRERKASDKKLRRCVISKRPGWKRELLANIMYAGVRIGGVHFLPTPFRWGFGNKWPRMRPPKSPPNVAPSH